MSFYSRSQQLTKNDEFAVERIIGKQYKKYGNLVFQEYLVKWLDYSEAEATWEPIMNLEGALQLVAEYERDLRKTNWKQKKVDGPEIQIAPGWSLDKKKDVRIDFRSRFTDKAYSYPFSFPTSSSKEITRTKLIKKQKYIGRKNTEQLSQESLSDQEKNSFENIAQTRQLLQLQQEKIMKDAMKKKAQKNQQKVATENKNSNQNSIQSGHFLRGDQADKILSCKRNQTDLQFLVSWKPRPNGQCPESNYFSSQALQQYAPDMLIDFYESKIKFNSYKLENVKENSKKDIIESQLIKSQIHKEKSNNVIGENRMTKRKKIQRTLLYQANYQES